MKKYISLAKKKGMLDAILISPDKIYFDIRAFLKCRWGCSGSGKNTMRCDYRNTTLEERIAIVKSYKNILLLHSNDAMQMSKALLEMERTAFLDGYYFAFALRCCNLCADCGAKRGDPCPTLEKLRPCEELFGIDVYKTARQLGLPIQVLQSKNDIPNRYGFLLID